MKLHIKSHFQVAEIARKEERPTMELPSEGGRLTVLKQVKSLHIKRHLLQANKDLETFIGDQNSETDDPFGRVLRRLRVHKGLRASVVASKACISVWQLYELETGKDTLFYTPGLRIKAAQRVAEFLGTDWSEILQARVMVRAVSTPTAQLHLLKTTSLGERLNNPKTAPCGAFDMGAAAHEGAATAPISSALFLRVADVQDNKSHGNLAKP
jgi:transcriptional regulator with XRE-family HTH domain